jgi:hypothetical protein
MVLLSATAGPCAETAKQQLIRALNGALGKARAQIVADIPAGQAAVGPTGQPAWSWERGPIFMSNDGRAPSRSVQTTTRVENPNNKPGWQYDPGSVTATTVIQDDPGQASSAFYLHPTYKFCFDALGNIYRWEAWWYVSRGPTPTAFEIEHAPQHLADAWELRVGKKGRSKVVHAMEGAGMWWIRN